MTDSVFTSAHVRLVTTSGSYRVVALNVTFAANGINSAVIEIAVGTSPSNNDRVDVDIQRGTPAILSVYDSVGPYEKTAHRLFTGVVYDFAPGNFMFGSFSIKVLLQGVLSLLDHGTLGSNSFIPKHFMDGNVAADIVGETTVVGEIANFIKPELVQASGMFTGMMQSFIDIANDQELRDGDGVTPFIQKYFSVEDNSVCSRILAGIGSDITPGSLDPADAVENNTLFQLTGATSPSGAGLVFKEFNDENVDNAEFIDGIVENLNNAQKDSGPYDSFLSRILGYGQQLMFSTVETPYAIWTVPFVPYFNSADAYTISADTISQVDWRLNPNTMLEMYQGAVITPGIGASLANSQTDSDVLAGFRLPITGRALAVPLPSVFGSVISDVVDLQRAENAREMTANIPIDAAVDLAKLYALKGNFDNRMIAVSCPFLRMDIAPLSPVRVNMPGSLDLQRALESSSIYGYVDQVVISMSAGERPSSRTTYVIKACRSYTQQRTLVDPFIASGFHPLFTNNWKGSRLDNRSHR